MVEVSRGLAEWELGSEVLQYLLVIKYIVFIKRFSNWIVILNNLQNKLIVTRSERKRARSFVTSIFDIWITLK